MKRFVYPAAFLVLIVLLVAVHSCDRPATASIKIRRLPGTATAVDAGKLRRELDGANDSYRRDCLRLQQEFRDGLRSAVASEYRSARRGIEPCVSTLSGFGACAKMCYKAVKDRACGTNDFAEAFQEVIQDPIIMPCVRANRIAADRLQNLKLRLEERRLQYGVEVAQACRNAGIELEQPDADLKALTASLERSFGVTRELHISTVMAAVSGIVEAVFLKTTLATLRGVLAKAIAKLAGSGTTGAICAAADGPLPIGDVIGAVLAAGGLAWTAYDIYEACEILPEQLRTELRTGIDSAERELRRQAESEADRLTDAYLKVGAGVAAAIGDNL